MNKYEQWCSKIFVLIKMTSVLCCIMTLSQLLGFHATLFICTLIHYDGKNRDGDFILFIKQMKNENDFNMCAKWYVSRNTLHPVHKNNRNFTTNFYSQRLTFHIENVYSKHCQFLSEFNTSSVWKKMQPMTWGFGKF